MNPEFRKHLWMELTLHKLVATPVLLAITMTLAFLSVEDISASIQMLERTLIILFWAFTSLGGSYAVATAIHQEYDNKTWDWVRLNSQPVWRITWGTILGSSSFMWYAGTWCLVAYFALSFFNPTDVAVTIQTDNLLLLLALAIFLQGTSMMSICMMFTGNGERAPSRRNAAISALLLALILFPFHDWKHTGDIRWYTIEMPARMAASIIASLFAVWSWTGSLRLLRTQLQYRNGVAVWVAFSVFLMIFINGFITGDQLFPQETTDTLLHEKLRLYTGFYISMALAYIMLFMDPPTIKTFNDLTAYIRGRNWRRVEQTVPLWIVSGIMATVILIPVLALSIRHWHHEDGAIYFSAAAVFLLVRDGAIFTAFAYGKHPQRAPVTTFVYLFCLYVIIPLISLKLSEDPEILQAFLPNTKPFSPLLMFVHATFASLWAGNRILRHQKLLHSPS